MQHRTRNYIMAEKSAEQLYEARTQRIAAATALKETDRVPFFYTTRFWAARVAGITCQEQMYDADKARCGHQGGDHDAAARRDRSVA